MFELTGNLWNYHAAGIPICITTNGSIRRDGACVMGRGIAKQAADKFLNLPLAVGRLIQAYGIEVRFLHEYNLIVFPVKYVWSEPADLDLISQSALELNALADKHRFGTVALPRPGCGNGQLKWEDVKPRLDAVLDNRFEIVEWKP